MKNYRYKQQMYNIANLCKIAVIYTFVILSKLFFMYCLINEQESVLLLLSLKPRAPSASGFRLNKTQPASLLNGFKHDYKFNRYTALLVFFI